MLGASSPLALGGFHLHHVLPLLCSNRPSGSRATGLSFGQSSINFAYGQRRLGERASTVTVAATTWAHGRRRFVCCSAPSPFYSTSSRRSSFTAASGEAPRSRRISFMGVASSSSFSSASVSHFVLSASSPLALGGFHPSSSCSTSSLLLGSGVAQHRAGIMVRHTGRRVRFADLVLATKVIPVRLMTKTHQRWVARPLTSPTKNYKKDKTTLNTAAFTRRRLPPSWWRLR